MIFSLVLGPPSLGCYRPSITDGNLFCGPGSSCPEGFACMENHCYRSGSRQEGGSERPPVDSGAEAGGGSKHGLGESCDPVNAGTPNRTDNCEEGLVCVQGNMGYQCFKRCSGTADCDGAACESRRIEVGSTAAVMVCALPPTKCDPTLEVSPCPNNGICYLTSPTETTCETTSGEGIRTACKYSRDCLYKFTCATQGPGARYCYPTCSTAAPNCPANTVCQPTTAGATYSYCY